MAFGTGSAVAHRAVDAVLGPRTIQHENVVSEAAAAPAPTASSMGADACSIHTKAFQEVWNLLTLLLFGITILLHAIYLISFLFFNLLNLC